MAKALSHNHLMYPVKSFMLLALSLLFISACAERKESSTPLLEARSLPKEKVDLWSQVSVPLLSSSPAQASLLADQKVIRRFSLEEGDSAIGFQQPTEPKDYRLQIENEDGLKTSSSWRVRYPTLEEGSRGKAVELLHNHLRRLGYGNAPQGNIWNEYTSLAVLAFRKTNGLGFEEKASPEVLRMLLRGQGEFPLLERKPGRYVEVDLTRQVMVLAEDGQPQMTYHISSGAPSTPSDLGRYTFYSKLPGTNALGMFYSVFYNRGEATHGYPSVPSYPASHGCIRNPLASSVQIYNWIPLGAPIWVYY